MPTIITKDTIGQAHDEIMRHFLNLWKIDDQEEVEIKNKGPTIESPGMTVHVNYPFLEPFYSPALEFGPLARQKYIEEMTTIREVTGGKQDFEYVYSNRLMDYPHKEVRLEENCHHCGETHGYTEWHGDGKKGKVLDPTWTFYQRGNVGINQIDHIVETLVHDHTNRQSQGVTWVVEKDIRSESPPCLQQVQFLIRDSRLNMHATFRSHDMCLGWSNNVPGLAALQKKVIVKICDHPDFKDLSNDLKIGYIETYSAVAHIYTKQEAVHKFRGYLNI